jgi:hypothetical protein
MATQIYYEVLSPAMKVKLDPKYRRVLQAEQHPKSNRFWNNVSKNNHESVLPFTTKTRAYGTYGESKR